MGYYISNVSRSQSLEKHVREVTKTPEVGRSAQKLTCYLFHYTPGVVLSLGDSQAGGPPVGPVLNEHDGKISTVRNCIIRVIQKNSGKMH